MNNTNKIIIIGTIGSGKSIMSQKLKEIYGYEVYHSDLLVYKDIFKLVSIEEQHKIYNNVFNKQTYILDGYAIEDFGNLDPNVDLLIILDLPYLICVIRAFIRYFNMYWEKPLTKHKIVGQKRNNKKKKMHFIEIRYIVWVYYSKLRVKRVIKKNLPNSIVLRSKKQITKFLKSL